jgi:ArsR family metal-binding transcriptional regulator
MGYTLHDIGAYPEPPTFHRIASNLTQPPSVTQPGKTSLNMGFVLNRFLPRTNCKRCGKPTCLAFAVELARKKVTLEDCPVLQQPEFAAVRASLVKLIE